MVIVLTAGLPASSANPVTVIIAIIISPGSAWSGLRDGMLTGNNYVLIVQQGKVFADQRSCFSDDGNEILRGESYGSDPAPGLRVVELVAVGKLSEPCLQCLGMVELRANTNSFDSNIETLERPRAILRDANVYRAPRAICNVNSHHDGCPLMMNGRRSS